MNIKEAFSYPIGTEFNVIFKDGTKYNTGNVVYIDSYFFKKADNKRFKWRYDNEICSLDLAMLTADYELSKKLVSFEEAVKSGKPISFKYDGMFVENGNLRDLSTAFSIRTDEWIRNAIERGEFYI